MIYAIDGGPCTGKTTLIRALRRRGHPVVREAARAIMKREYRRTQQDPEHIPILPNTHFREFQRQVASTTIDRLIKAQEQHPNKPVFTDRHLPSQLAYAKTAGFPVPTMFYNLIEKHAPTRVFILDRLPYRVDNERVEDDSLAQTLHDNIIEAYESVGADIIHVPVKPTYTANAGAELRANYVLERLINQEEHIERERKFFVPHDNVRERLYKLHTKLVRAGKEETWVRPGTDRYTRVRKWNDLYEETKKFSLPRNPDVRKELTKTTLWFPVREDPETMIYYENHTEEHQMIGDAGCVVSLDNITGLGEYVEIEARSNEQLDAMQRRLGINEEPIRKAYWELRAA